MIVPNWWASSQVGAAFRDSAPPETAPTCVLLPGIG
jgi:hypothetical protein